LRYVVRNSKQFSKMSFLVKKLLRVSDLWESFIKIGVVIKNLKELFKYVKGMTSRADEIQLTDEDKFIEYFHRIIII